jgi:indolepyruvate ferredoxin oxidoreductase
MVANADVHFPAIDSLDAVIRRSTRASENIHLDADHIAETLLHNHLAGNIISVGAAYQQGLIPLPEKCILEAIRLNGAAIELNLEAFRWGRIYVAQPALVSDALASATTGQDRGQVVLNRRLEDLVDWSSDELRRLLEIRVHELSEYQDDAYAKRYVDLVRKIAEREQSASRTTDVAEAVARSLYKLMAYKDEYEVARLHLDAAAQAALSNQFGDDVTVYWMLHPPILRAMGLKRKLSLGPWFKPAFSSLRAMRRVRGTRFDVFGYAKVRRIERELIEQYRDVMDRATEVLSPANHDDVLTLAKLPDQVRGYEHIKERAVGEYEAAMGSLGDRLGVTVSALSNLP